MIYGSLRRSVSSLFVLFLGTRTLTQRAFKYEYVLTRVGTIVVTTHPCWNDKIVQT